jgi:ring-1,2-phenylacetyl-CoA epoxidase subunit PaaC
VKAHEEVALDSVSLKYALGLADDCLVMAQRLGAYVSFAPELEIDMAISNIALDLLGQARGFYTYCSELDPEARSEDDFAMSRDASEFRNHMLLEQPNTDFAYVVARQFFFDVFQKELFERLSGSQDLRLAAVAKKGMREADYHLDFSQSWVLRLGDGTPTSRIRMQAAVDGLWPFTSSLFAPEEALGDGIDPALLEGPWRKVVTATLDVATLDVPGGLAQERGGRDASGSQYRAAMIEEMQEIQRAHPGLEW